MSTSIKPQELHAMSVEEQSFKKDSLLEKPQGCLQEPDKHHTYQSRFSVVENVDTSTVSFYQNKLKISGKFFSGLQDEIYE